MSKPIVVINASAGSGKTELMSNIFLYLLILNSTNHTTNKNFILALTFSKAAVNELKKRIINKILNLFYTQNEEKRKKLLLNILNSTNKIFSNNNININDIINKIHSHKTDILQNIYNLSVFTFDSFYSSLFKLLIFENLQINPNSNFSINTNYIVDNNEYEAFIKKFIFFLLSEPSNSHFFNYFINEQLENNFSTNYHFYLKEKIELFKNEKFLSLLKNKLNFTDSELDLFFEDLIKELSLNFQELSSFKKFLKSSKLLNKTINFLFDKINTFKKKYNEIFLEDLKINLLEYIKENKHIIYQILSKYKYILLDEFQDTSYNQYIILKEFIEEIISTTNEPSVFIVGDPKQNIYRWRNTDWTLLTDTIFKDFNNENFKRINQLEEFGINNYRSSKLIVEFNNLFFEKVIENFFKKNNELKKVYKNFKQNSITKLFGILKIRPIIPQNSNNENFNKEKYKWILEEISFLKEHNINDIAILVRKNEEAKEIYNYLFKNINNLPNNNIYSDSSISYESSPIIRFIIYFIASLYTNDTYHKNCAQINFYKINGHQLIEYDNLKEEIISEYPNFILLPFPIKVSLLFEYIKKTLKVSNDLESLIVTDFLDYATKLCFLQKNNEIEIIHDLLENLSLSINIINNPNSIKIMTIHKTKGLEFDGVIVNLTESFFQPYKSKNYLYLNLDNFFNENSKTLIFKEPNIELFQFLENLNTQDNISENLKILCNEIYNQTAKELNFKLIDIINLIYVAFTRAKKALIIKFDLINYSHLKNKTNFSYLSKNQNLIDKIKFDSLILKDTLIPAFNILYEKYKNLDTFFTQKFSFDEKEVKEGIIKNNLEFLQSTNKS